MTPVVFGYGPTAGRIAFKIVIQVVIVSTAGESDGVIRQLPLQPTEIGLR